MPSKWFEPLVDKRKFPTYWITNSKGNPLLFDNTTGALLWKVLEQAEEIRGLKAALLAAERVREEK